MKTREKLLEELVKKVKNEIGKTQPSGFKLLTNYYPKDAKDQIDDIFKIIESQLSVLPDEQKPSDEDIKTAANDYANHSGYGTNSQASFFGYILGAKDMRDGKIPIAPKNTDRDTDHAITGS